MSIPWSLQHTYELVVHTSDNNNDDDDDDAWVGKAVSFPPDWSWDVLRLCEEYRDRGIVGIDMAGDEGSNDGETFSAPVGQLRAEKKNNIH